MHAWSQVGTTSSLARPVPLKTLGSSVHSEPKKNCVWASLRTIVFSKKMNHRRRKNRGQAHKFFSPLKQENALTPAFASGDLRVAPSPERNHATARRCANASTGPNLTLKTRQDAIRARPTKRFRKL
jgi:hypothetical protein